MIEGRVTLGSDEGMIVVRPAAGQGLVVLGEVPVNSLLRPSSHGGELWIMLPSQFGPFDITAREYDAPPAMPDQSWEAIVEISVRTTSSIVVSEVADNGERLDWVSGRGTWRLRMAARVGGLADEIGDDSVIPTEEVLLEAWPELEYTVDRPAEVLRLDPMRWLG